MCDGGNFRSKQLGQGRRRESSQTLTFWVNRLSLTCLSLTPVIAAMKEDSLAAHSTGVHAPRLISRSSIDKVGKRRWCTMLVISAGCSCCRYWGSDCLRTASKDLFVSFSGLFHGFLGLWNLHRTPTAHRSAQFALFGMICGKLFTLECSRRYAGLHIHLHELRRSAWL